MRKFILIFLMGIFIRLHSQNCPAVEFNYDVTGNRIQRQQIQIICGNPNSRTIQQTDNQTTIKDTLNAIAYPNPTSDKVILNITDTNIDRDEWKEILLSDMNGKILLQLKTKDSIKEIPVNNYTRGVYILSVISKNRQKTFQIIKTD